MEKHIEITIQHAQMGKFMSPEGVLDDWNLGIKALELALRMNPSLLDGFDEDDGPFIMY